MIIAVLVVAVDVATGTHFEVFVHEIFSKPGPHFFSGVNHPIWSQTVSSKPVVYYDTTPIRHLEINGAEYTLVSEQTGNLKMVGIPKTVQGCLKLTNMT